MPEGDIKITVLGSGTSAGVPTIGCHCDVCESTDPRDKRLRPSILISYNGRNILIDTTPDLRTQALRAGITRLDAVIFTHEHADHIMGLDDVRPFNFRQKHRIPIYAAADTMEAVQRCFRYVFDGRKAESMVPQLDPHVITAEPFELFGLRIQPVPLMHGKSSIFGFRFGRSAYLTDHSEIPKESMGLLRGLDVLFLDALRYKPHPTHSTVDRSVQTVRELRPARAFFTHICHDLGHMRAESLLPEGVRLAYDGLELWVESSPIRIHRAAEDAREIGPTALTVGNFDGVHAGHRAILRRVRDAARQQGLMPVALTFDPHPTKVVAPERAPRLMTTAGERARLMAEEGIERLVALPFDRKLAEMTPEEFVREIIVGILDAKVVFVGDNFRFGCRQSGNVDVLRTLGERYAFATHVVSAVTVRGRQVSSTAVRQLLDAGNVSAACRLLGRPYALEGAVIKGKGIGSRQTVPTLNLSTASEVIPADGVYITRTTDLDTLHSWESASNVGMNPTFGGTSRSIETFLLETPEGEGPKRIRVEFLYRLRDERTYASAEQLKAQILRDVNRTRKYFRLRRIMKDYPQK